AANNFGSIEDHSEVTASGDAWPTRAPGTQAEVEICVMTLLILTRRLPLTDREAAAIFDRVSKSGRRTRRSPELKSQETVDSVCCSLPGRGMSVPGFCDNMIRIFSMLNFRNGKGPGM
ncbi:hypothetical protein ACW9HQ_42990, partial [Nocardia gipuzkoensis]